MVKKTQIMVLASAGFLLVPTAQAGTFTEALVGGKPSVDMRLRSETVDQDDAANKDNAKALTLRTRLGYLTGDFAGFKAFAEMTHTTTLNTGDEYYAPGPFTNNETDYDTVADPELSRLNQAWVSYSGLADTSVKLGRQRVILDNARFVGNVGWRQTEQVYNALVLANTSIQDTTLIYGYVQRAYNIVGAETPSESHVINASYNGLSFGKITGYAYLLDLNLDSPAGDSKTLGLSFDGKQALGDFTLLYNLEYAKQNDYADAGSEVDASYTKVELGGKFAGIMLKVAQEKLGSNGEGANGTYGFQTVLATKHAFNGWADMFLSTPNAGLVDNYVTIGAKPAGIKLLAVYHQYKSDEGGDDYGTELNLLAAKKFSKNYSAGIKYASYKEGDDLASKKDTNKLWVWGQLKF
ncbi:MAG: alginate export family protein [Candidatus Polarisedimenticolaceae bacterium]|nr:alginate export family protein [Candidatus Polarisedimenticolaceae bacterium]